MITMTRTPSANREPVLREGEAPAEPSLPRARKHPAHGVHSSVLQPTIVFLTVCTKGRAPWLATPEVHENLRSVWRAATDWAVGRYVLMPDHLHLFPAPGPTERTLDTWVRYWKSRFRKRDANPSHRWQTDHWDTRLRDDENYESKWEYVKNNPVRHGLVERSDDWPFQGTMNDLPW